MKKLIFTIFVLSILCSLSYTQRILINENFETSGFTPPDSLPTGWLEFDVDNSNPSYPNAKWKARDTSAMFPGVNAVLHSRAHTGHRSMSIPWRAGDPEADDFVFLDSTRIQTGDSLIFWMLYGTPHPSLIGGVTFSPYIDSMQVGYSIIQDPNIWVKLGPTLVSLDSNNIWQEYKYNLSSLNGQNVYLGFRYWMNTTIDGLWCNIDDIFVGNRSAIGIKPIGTNVPKSFALRQNYPNPFNPVTNIEFDLPKSEYVSLVVYNTLGQQVRTLVAEDLKAGSYKVDFDAKDLPSGAYFYRINAGTFSKTSKMILTK